MEEIIKFSHQNFRYLALKAKWLKITPLFALGKDAFAACYTHVHVVYNILIKMVAHVHHN